MSEQHRRSLHRQSSSSRPSGPPRSARPLSAMCGTSSDSLYAQSLTRHALLNASFSLPLDFQPPSSLQHQRHLSQSTSSLQLLPPQHQPLFMSASSSKPLLCHTYSASSLALNEVAVIGGAPVGLLVDDDQVLADRFVGREQTRKRGNLPTSGFGFGRLRQTKGGEEWTKKLSKYADGGNKFCFMIITLSANGNFLGSA